MAMSPRLLRPRASAGYGLDAMDWQSRVVANGGTVSASTMKAVDTFCKTIVTAGIRDRFIRLNPLCGNFTAALVPLYRGQSRTGTQFGNTTDTNNGPFVSGDYTEAGGLVGNGTSKYLSTGLNLSELPDIGTGHLSVFKGAGASTSRVLIGSRSSGSTHYYRYDIISGANRGLWGNVIIAASAAANTVKAHAIVSRTSSTSLTLYHDGVSVGTSSSTATPGLPGRDIYVFAENDNGPTVGSYWPHAIFAYSIGLSLNATQVASFNTAIQALATALGR